MDFWVPCSSIPFDIFPLKYRFLSVASITSKQDEIRRSIIHHYSTAGTSSTSHQAQFYYYAIMLMVCYSSAAQSLLGVTIGLIVSSKQKRSYEVFSAVGP